eukprot:916418-Ditylum_brightwellii.AAC.1
MRSPWHGHNGMMRKVEFGISIKARPQPRQSAESPETCATEHRLDVYVMKSDRSLMMWPFTPPSAIIM